MKSFELEVKVAGPFDFPLSLKFYTRSRLEAIDRVEDGSYHRLLRVQGRVCRIQVAATGNSNHPRLMVKVLAPSFDNKIQMEVSAYVKNIFRADYQLTDFYRFCRRDRILKKMSERFCGLKNLQTPHPFEILVWAIIGQQVGLDFAYRLKQRLVEKFGEYHFERDPGLYLFPAAEILAELESGRLRELQYSRNKADYIIGLAKSVCSREINLDNLCDFDDNAVREQLLAIRGIGRWSCEYCLLRAFGRDDACPAGDAGLRRALSIHYGIDSSASERQIGEFMERFRPYRGMVTYYLWFSLLENG